MPEMNLNKIIKDLINERDKAIKDQQQEKDYVKNADLKVSVNFVINKKIFYIKNAIITEIADDLKPALTDLTKKLFNSEEEFNETVGK